MDGPLHLAPAGVAAARVRVVGAAHRHHLPGGVALDARALDDVGVAQAHLGTGREPEVLRRRRIAEVVLLYIKDAGEGHLAAAGRRVLGVVDSVHLLDLPLRVVLDHDLERPQHGHPPIGATIEILAQAVLEERDVHDLGGLGGADALGEVADRFRRVAAAAQAHERPHARVVPAGDEALLDELEELPLGHDGVREVQAREFDLLWMMHAELVEVPVVERPVVLVLERADRVRDALDRIGLAVGPVVHGVDAPGVTRAMVRGLPDPVHDGIAQVEVTRGHVDLRAQGPGPVFELARAHAAEQVQVLLAGAIAVRTLPARLGQGTAVLGHLIGREIVHVGRTRLDELHGPLIELFEVIARVVEVLAPVEAEPAHGVDDRVDVLLALLGGIGVVEAQVAAAAELLGHAEVD